jgi:hypothetical protein
MKSDSMRGNPHDLRTKFDCGSIAHQMEWQATTQMDEV